MTDPFELNVSLTMPSPDELQNRAAVLLSAIRGEQRHRARAAHRRGLDERERLLVAIIRTDDPMRTFQARVRSFLLAAPLGGDVRDLLWETEPAATVAAPGTAPGREQKLPSRRMRPPTSEGDDRTPVKPYTLARVLAAIGHVLDNPRLQRRLQRQPFHVRQENRALARIFVRLWAGR